MDRPPRKLPEKRDALRSFLERHSARIFLDPRREGVMVPKWLAGQPELVLRLGYGLTPPMPDLELGADAVSCTLSFKGSPFWCCIPWTAIYAVISDDETDGQGLVWPEDVPIESQFGKSDRPRPRLAAVTRPVAVPPLPAEPEAEADQPRATRPRPKNARAEDGARSGDAGAATEPGASKTKRPLPSYLRVVK